MARPRLPIPTERECADCCKSFPFTTEHFNRSTTCLGGLAPVCKLCNRLRKRVAYNSSAPAMRARRRNQRPLRENEICPECCDLPHRVEGPKCWRCGEEYAPLPPLDVRDYLYRSPDRELT